MKRNHKQLLASANTAKKNPLTTLAIAMSIGVSMPIVAYAATNGETTATAGGAVSSDNAYKSVTTQTTGTTSTGSSGAAAGNTNTVTNDDPYNPVNNPYGIDPNKVANAADYEGVADASESTIEAPSAVTEQAVVCATEMQKEVAEVAQAQAEIAAMAPETDKVYKGDFANAAEQVKGCFTKAQDYINLASLVPTVPDSTGVSIKLNEIINQKINQLKTSVMDRACEIGTSAISNALKPVQDSIGKAQNAMLVFNNPNDFVSDVVAKQIDAQFGKVDLGFNKIMDDLDAKIADSESQWATKAASLNQQYETAINSNPVVSEAYQTQLDKLKADAAKTTSTSVQNVNSITTYIPASQAEPTVVPDVGDYETQKNINTGTVTGSTTGNLYNGGTTTATNMYNNN